MLQEHDAFEQNDTMECYKNNALELNKTIECFNLNTFVTV